MTPGLFAVIVPLVFVSAAFAYLMGEYGLIKRHISREVVTLVPTVAVVGALFGLFMGFNLYDISQRAGGLRLAIEREVSAARSILNFASGVGPTADPLRNAVIEYLQIVTTTERDWFGSDSQGEAPGEAAVYSLALVTTLFVEQTRSSDVIKTLLVQRVDELTNARTERVTRMRRHDDISLWFGLAVLAAVTQFVGAVALSGKRLQLLTFLAGYTLAALVGFLLLARADRLIGPDRIEEQSIPFEALLSLTLSGG
jgi:arginine exporter protein ArgO